MKMGYARVSKADGRQVLDLQFDALQQAGVDEDHLYTDQASGKLDDRAGLESCLKALREGDTLIVWKLDRLGRSLKHLADIVHSLSEKNIGFKVLSGQGADIDTATAAGKLVFGIFASLAEFERELIRERSIACLKASRVRGRKGGRRFQLTKNQVRFLQATMQNKETNVSDLCQELGVFRQTLHRYVSPARNLAVFIE